MTNSITQKASGAPPILLNACEKRSKKSHSHLVRKPIPADSVCASSEPSDQMEGSHDLILTLAHRQTMSAGHSPLPSSTRVAGDGKKCCNRASAFGFVIRLAVILVCSRRCESSRCHSFATL